MIETENENNIHNTDCKVSACKCQTLGTIIITLWAYSKQFIPSFISLSHNIAPSPDVWSLYMSHIVVLLTYKLE